MHSNEISTGVPLHPAGQEATSCLDKKHFKGKRERARSRKKKQEEEKGETVTEKERGEMREGEKGALFDSPDWGERGG